MNAKKELIKAVKTNSIKCATITINYAYRYSADQPDSVVDGAKYGSPKLYTSLKVDHCYSQLKDFLNTLDIDYDCGYGTQELYGTVWLTDGTWLSREEYDGSESWLHNVLPTIPQDLIETDVDSLWGGIWTKIGKSMRPKKETDVSIQGDDFTV